MFYNKKSVAIPILTVWFLCGGFIIMNNLYIGSIFSYLSAIQSPILPSNWKSLVESDIPITTTTPIYMQVTTEDILKESLLIHSLIPTYSRLFENNPTLVQTFDKLYNKIVHIDVTAGTDTFAQILRNIEIFIDDQTYGNKSVYTGRTFAIMDEVGTLDVYSKLLKWNGSRLIVQGTGQDTPFGITVVDIGLRNFLVPIFNNILGLLRSTGFEDRWNKLDKTYALIYKGCEIDNTSYKKYFAKAISNFREPISFHESDPVSLKSVKGVFLVCNVFILLSFVSVVKEVGCKEAMHYILNSLSRMGRVFYISFSKLLKMFMSVRCIHNLC